MRKLEINDLIQIAGMLGIIGSLVFVGLQMKQTQTIALGEQVQARNQMLLDSQLILLGDEHIGRELMNKSNIAVLNPINLSDEVRAVWRANDFCERRDYTKCVSAISIRPSTRGCLAAS